jgi:O-antigen/teichoic acid export membrane protein
VFFGYGLAGLYGGFIAGLVAGGILYLRFLPLRFASYSWRHLKSLLKYSIWALLAAGTGLIFTYADVIMIGYFWSNFEVGIYRTTLQLTSVATFIAVSLNSVLFPKISRWSTENNLKAIERSLCRAFSYSLLLAVPVCAGGLIIGDRLLYYFYGAPFVAGTPALQFCSSSKL